MPNGDPNWMKDEYPKLEEFFGKISTVLEDFANKYNLLIDKYYHQGKDWTFRFRHPEGGTGQIFVLKRGEDQVGVAVSWQIADRKTCTSYSKHTEIENYSLEESVLLEALTRHLKLVLSWQKEEMEQSKQLHSEWKQIRKKDFEKRELSYPFPKLE